MKVLHLSTPSSWRGGEQQVAHLMRALAEKNIDQALLSPHNSELARRTQSLPVVPHHFNKRGLLDSALAIRLRRISREEQITLIHCHDSHAHSAAVIANAFFGNSQPLVVSRRVDFAISSGPFSRWKYNHPSVKRIICVSDKIREITAPGLDNPSLLRVVHSGIDTGIYEGIAATGNLHRELGLPADTPLVGNLSALADHKDYPTFLRCARTLLDKGFKGHFLIAGTGPEEAAIKATIESLNLRGRVHLLGFRKDVPALLAELDLFLMTSKTEGLGTIVIEALAAGIPVVAARAGGIPELILDGECGLLGEIGDAEGLSRLVLRIFEEPALRHKLVEQGRQRAKQFSYRHTAALTLSIYHEVQALSRG